MWKNVVAPTAVVILCWIVSSGITTYYIHLLEASHEHILEKNLSTIQAAGGMRHTLRNLHRVLLNAPGPNDAKAIAEADQLQTLFHQQMAAAATTATSSDERELIRKIQRSFAVYRDELQLRLTTERFAEMQTTAGLQRLVRMSDAVADACKQLGDLNENLINKAASDRNELGAAIYVIRFGLLIIGPAGGIACGFWMARRFHRSLSQISVTLSGAAMEMEEQVARINVSGSGDITQVQSQAQVVAGRIREVVEELQQARRNAIAAARLAAVGELAAGVAHELRNPLTSVKLLIQTAVQRQPDRPLSEKQWNVIQSEISRMENTIETLLHFAKPPQMRRLRHDLRDTVRRALNLIEGKASHAKVVLQEQFPVLPVEVDADPEQLHQAFINMLLNGIEAMTDGGTLRVVVDLPASAPGRCRVHIQDTGPGIPSHIMDRIFEPFVTGKQVGTGLGLAISRRIVQENGGILTAANPETGGALFTVELPLLTAASKPLTSLPRDGHAEKMECPIAAEMIHA